MFPLMAAKIGAGLATGGGGIATAAGGSGLVSSILGGASVLGDSGMFGGGGGSTDNSKAISGGPWYQGDFITGDDAVSKFAMIGVVILLIILLAKGK